MNRNKGRKIAVRLFALRDYLYANADQTHAVKTEDIMEHYQSREFENTSLKTVYSDLHAIRGKDYEIDVAYDEKAKGWLLYNPRCCGEVPQKMHNQLSVFPLTTDGKWSTENSQK